MNKYEISILLITICVAGVAFNIKITDLTIFKTFKVKNVNINFKSYLFFKLWKKIFKKKTKKTFACKNEKINYEK
jgi:hypothetical protein